MQKGMPIEVAGSIAIYVFKTRTEPSPRRIYDFRHPGMVAIRMDNWLSDDDMNTIGTNLKTQKRDTIFIKKIRYWQMTKF